MTNFCLPGSWIPQVFPGEEKVFIGSPWSKHVPNGRQNDIRRGLLEAKWFPGMAFGVFGGSWVSIGLPGTPGGTFR